MCSLENCCKFFEIQSKLNVNNMDLVLFTDYCKYLRNLCASGSDSAQSDIVNCNKLVENCFEILIKISESNNTVDTNNTLVKSFHFGLQFIGNLIVGHNKNKAYIWIQYFPTIRCWLLNTDAVTRNYIEMITYNLLLDIYEVQLQIREDVKLLELFILDAYNELEFACFLMEKILPNNLEIIYQTVSESYRLNLLKLLNNFLNDPKISLATSVYFIKNLAKMYLEKVNYPDKMDYIECEILMEALHIIINLSYYSQYKSSLQDDVSFVSFMIDKMCFVQNMALEGDNVFTPIWKLDVDPAKAATEHPLNSLRGILIRIIGNMCYRNKIIQDKVREMNGIYVILDSCKYDAKNPFIMQWSIFAVANLCYNNLENQEIIRSLPIDCKKIIKSYEKLTLSQQQENNEFIAKKKRR